MGPSHSFRALSHDTSSGCRTPVCYLPDGDAGKDKRHQGWIAQTHVRGHTVKSLVNSIVIAIQRLGLAW